MKKNHIFYILIMLVLILPINLYAKVSAIESTATDLDENNITSVTKSLPSYEYANNSKNIDVVLVLDNSDTNISKINSEASDLLSKLSESNLNVKVSVIKFDGWAHDTISIVRDNKNEGAGLIEVNDDNLEIIKNAINYNLRSYFTSFVVGGTNTEVPLKMAKKMLDDDTDVVANRKYIVLFSDMESWVYEGYITIDGVKYGPAPVTKTNPDWGGGSIYGDSDYTWEEVYNSCKDGTFEQQENYDKNQYFNYQYTKTVFGFTITLPVSWKNYWTNIYTGDDKDKLLAITNEQYRTYFKTEWNPYITSDGSTITKKANGLDVSLCKTYNVLKDIKNSNYNISLYSTDTLANANNFKHKAIGLIKAMQDDFGMDIYGNTEADDTIVNYGSSIDTLFDNFENNISYFLVSGNITDNLAKNFQFINDDEDVAPLSLSVNNEELNSVKLASNKWGYGDVSSEGKYDYEVEYDEDSNKLNIDLNHSIKNTSPLTLKYKLKLLTLETNEYPTSDSTVLTYYDNVNKDSAQVDIDIPEVSYVKAIVPSEPEVIENPKTGISSKLYLLIVVLLGVISLIILRKKRIFKKNI